MSGKTLGELYMAVRASREQLIRDLEALKDGAYDHGRDEVAEDVEEILKWGVGPDDPDWENLEEDMAR